ncbi:MAG: 3-dehydroquinate synthase [Planctomycetes bacterium]|nr:3-dehydroquinate synthase [Planctomycetota bacterium]
MPTDPWALAASIPSQSDTRYQIEVAPGLSARAGARLLAWGLRPGPIAVISEASLLDLHGAPLLASLRAAGFQPTPCLVTGGEAHKTLAAAAKCYPLLAAAGVDRSSTVLAFGGGVVGDLAGYVAATWMRGVPLVQVPTTLLAMVDSSVGGKTAVDLPQGKNLVGAFKQPEGVLSDPSLLATLPLAELRAGLGEVVKHGLIGAPALFTRLLNAPAEFATGSDDEAWSSLVREAVAVKVQIVNEDPYERGRRAVLNLGHTFGHAFELCSGYTLRHGEAVAVGLVAAAELGVGLDLAPASLPDEIRACLTGLGLPTSLKGIDPSAARQAMGQDKKKRAGLLRFVVPQSVGDVALVADPGPPVDAALEAVLRPSAAQAD